MFFACEEIMRKETSFTAFRELLEYPASFKKE
jgi:hypothetical protein